MDLLNLLFDKDHNFYLTRKKKQFNWNSRCLPPTEANWRHNDFFVEILSAWNFLRSLAPRPTLSKKKLLAKFVFSDHYQSDVFTNTAKSPMKCATTDNGCLSSCKSWHLFEFWFLFGISDHMWRRPAAVGDRLAGAEANPLFHHHPRTHICQRNYFSPAPTNLPQNYFSPAPTNLPQNYFLLAPTYLPQKQISLAPIFATSTLFHSKAKLASLNMFWQYSLPMLVGPTSFPAILSSLSVTTMCKPLPICSAFFWTHVNNSKTNGSVKLFLGKVRKRKRRYPIRFLSRSVQCFETGLRGVCFLPRFCCAKSYVDPLIAGKRSICTYHPAFRPLPHSCWAFVGKH